MGIQSKYLDYIENWEDMYYTLSNSNRKYFAVKLIDNSMSLDYYEGDTIIFKRVNSDTKYEDGHVYMIMINNDEALFRQVFINSAGITLAPINEAFEPTFYSKKQIKELNVKIIGIPVELRRKLSF